MWATAATTPVTWSSTSAVLHFSPITNVIRSPANRVRPNPNGIAHISATRLTLTNDSRNSSTRFWTAQIAGYSVPLTRSSTLVVNALMFAATATAPTPASPRCALVAIAAALATTTDDSTARKIGAEKAKYSFTDPGS